MLILTIIIHDKTVKIPTVKLSPILASLFIKEDDDKKDAILDNPVIIMEGTIRAVEFRLKYSAL